MAPLLIAILAAYLGSRFQMRAALHAALREVWSHLIEAKTELTAYVALEAPRPEDYRSAFKTISRAIDEIRGVYSNVGETGQALGIHPYEPLHDMRKALKTLDPSHGPASEETTEAAGDAVEQAWRSLRYGFLKEFETRPPTRAITDHWSRDPRRPLQPPA